MWVTFVKWNCLGTWTVRTDDGEVKQIAYFNQPEPIANTVRYKLAVVRNEGFLYDFLRVDWTLGPKAQYAPRAVGDILDADAVSHMKSPDARRWLKLDIDFHITALAPGRAWYDTLECIQTGDLHALVYRGGVDPVRLRRFTSDAQLLSEAHVIKIITDLCKTHRCVWLRHDDEVKQCSQFMVESDHELIGTLIRLVKVGVLRLRKNPNGLALTWMADQLAKFAVAPPLATYKKHVAPSAAQVGLKRVDADHTMAVDDIIDRGFIADTMTVATWPNVPYEGHVVMHSYAAAIQHAKLWCERNATRSIAIFSSSGTLQFDCMGYTVLHKGVARFIRHATPEAADVESLSGAVRLSMLTLPQIPQFHKTELDAVVAVMNHEADMRWIPWLQSWTGNPEVLAVVVLPLSHGQTYEPVRCQTPPPSYESD